MINEKKFNPRKLEKLNNPQRLVDIPPEYICERLDIENPQVLVEIGAGTAFFSIAFLEHLKPSLVYACDISEVMIDWVKENVVPNHPKLIPVKSEENSVPLDDQMADLLFMINLQHELDNPSLILAESHRILKPDGKIFIVDWKKTDMPEGPPTQIRWLPEQVGDELVKSGFGGVNCFNEWPKHYLVVAEKMHQASIDIDRGTGTG
jgi:ubiquinone/menaquinone biosynthesis C-methylase UbiE